MKRGRRAVNRIKAPIIPYVMQLQLETEHQRHQNENSNVDCLYLPKFSHLVARATLKTTTITLNAEKADFTLLKSVKVA